MKVIYSIIIPIYNGILFLKNNILVKPRQKSDWGGVFFDGSEMINYEVIFIDDGSTDDSSDFIKEMQNKYDFIRLISRRLNKGNLFSRLEGAYNAKGEYILFFDQDDLYHRELLLELEKIRKRYCPDIISFKYHSIENNVIWNSYVRYPNQLITEKSLFMKENSTTMWNKAFSKKLFIISKIFWDKKYSYDEDRILVSILRSVARNQFDLDKDMYTWIIHENGLHTQIEKRINEYIDNNFQKYCLDFIKNKVSDDVFNYEIEYAVGHCYEGIIIISKSTIIPTNKKIQLYKTIRRSECFTIYLSKMMFSRNYVNKFKITTKFAIILYKRKLYRLLIFLSMAYCKINCINQRLKRGK